MPSDPTPAIGAGCVPGSDQSGAIANTCRPDGTLTNPDNSGRSAPAYCVGGTIAGLDEGFVRVSKGLDVMRAGETKKILGREQTPYVYQSFRNKFCFAGCFDPGNFPVPPTN